MSETHSLDRAVRHPDPGPRHRAASEADLIGTLRARVRRINLASLVVVLLLGAAGASIAAVDDSLGIVLTACVAGGSVLTVLTAMWRADHVVGTARPIAGVHTPPTGFSEPADAFRTTHLSGPGGAAGVGATDTTNVNPIVPAGPNGAPASAMARPPERGQPVSAFPTGFGDDSSDRRREVFGKIARRLQSLSNREIQKIDELEREIEDPDLLKGLYQIDHLATRVRRQAENLAVLGGEAPQRRSATAVSVYAVLRSAVAEVEHYNQVTIVPIESTTLRGQVAAEVVHLLAELLENATNFSAPNAGKVVLRAQNVTAGLALEVQDRGLGMPAEELQRINRLLDGSAQIDIGELLQDGRIGLAVVRELALRHDIRVRLQTNIFGGIDAAIVLPPRLLGDPIGAPERPKSLQPTRREQSPDAPPVGVPGTAAAAHPPSTSDTSPGLPVSQASPAHSGPGTNPGMPPAQTAPAHPGPRTNPGMPAPQATPAHSRAETRSAPDAAGSNPIPAFPAMGADPASGPAAAPAQPYNKPMPRTASRETPQPAPAGQPEGHAPVLPVREPGAGMFTDSRPPVEPRPSPELRPQPSRPPLPQRGGESHLPRELQEAPVPTRPIPGHNPSLMASFQQGLRRGRDETEAGRQQYPAQPDHDKSQGDMPNDQ